MEKTLATKNTINTDINTRINGVTSKLLMASVILTPFNTDDRAAPLPAKNRGLIQHVNSVPIKNGRHEIPHMAASRHAPALGITGVKRNNAVAKTSFPRNANTAVAGKAPNENPASNSNTEPLGMTINWLKILITKNTNKAKHWCC